MQTFIDEKTLSTAEGQEAQKILRKCVHCGFCTATCPTYQLLGDELDSPRGRIYLIKGLFEGKPADEKTRLHLDRCLTCRSCETTCPSGVDYGHLIDLGREKVEETTQRSVWERVQRYAIRKVIPFPKRFGFLIKLGWFFQPLLPQSLAKIIPQKQTKLDLTGRLESKALTRKMIVLEGCVQGALTPNTNLASKVVLAEFGIDLISLPEVQCCGSVDQHLAASDVAKGHMRRNIDAWWPELQNGAEGIVITASGCGAMVKDYGYHLRNEKGYAEKAKYISDKTVDLVEVIDKEDLSLIKRKLMEKQGQENSIACQIPCSLQHGQKLTGRLENVLTNLGFDLTGVKDPHLCCGSAGTYSILQKKLANQLRENKLKNLQAENPDMIVSANIGCQTFLQEKSSVPVKHWIEIIADGISK